MSNGIGKNPLNDISKVYVQQVVEKKKDDTYLEPDMKKRQANNEKARKELAKGPQMKNPHFESVEKSGWDAIKACSDGYKAVYKEEEVEVAEADSLAAMQARREKRLARQRKQMGTSSTGQDFGHDYGISSAERKKRQQAEFDKFVGRGKKTQKEALDPVGQEDGDVNNDGKKDSSDKYLMKRRKAIATAMASTKKKMTEGVRDLDPEKGTEERKARLEKKRGMKLDDHPQYKKEEVENVEELYKGKHGQSEKEYMDSRSDAGKQISGDSKMSGAAYSHRSFKGQGKPAKPGERQKAQGRMTQADRDELAIRKAALKKKSMKEAYSSWRQDLSEIMTDDISDKPIKEKKVRNTIKINPKLGEAIEAMGGELIEATEVDEAVYGGTPAKKEEPKDTRMTVTAADKKGNTPAYQRFKAGDKRYKAADHMKEEAAMSDAEVRLQKQKARIDQMIAQRRKQDLSKKSEAPTKAMGEATEDSLRDRRMERGGVDGNTRYDKAPKFAPGPSKKKYDGMSAVDIVKAEIRKKHGKGAIIDTKKK